MKKNKKLLPVKTMVLTSLVAAISGTTLSARANNDLTEKLTSQHQLQLQIHEISAHPEFECGISCGVSCAHTIS